MNIHTSFEAKTRANMKAIRARLMKPKAYKPTPTPTVDYFAPEWMRKITRFDHHVIAYYRRMETLQKYQDYQMPVRPSWEWKVQTFSQHIVDYYEFKKAVYDRQKQLDGVFPTYMRKPLPDILQEVKSLLDCQLSADELRGASRVRTCVEPRQYAMWAMRRLRPDMSYPQIGRFFGGRDHMTVLHGERKIEDLIKSGKSKLIYDGNQIRKVETKTRKTTVRRSTD